MAETIRNLLPAATREALRTARSRLRRGSHDWDDPQTFIPFRETVTSAARANQSVGGYIDATYNVPGVNQSTIRELEDLGVFAAGPSRVLELGPGSGRYLEQVLKRCRPESYEIYETAAPWAKWLTSNYDVTLRATDGLTLSSTPSESVDLAHAHKVMCVIPFMTICRYLTELMRVTRSGGFVVFDAPTEPCMTVEIVETWLESNAQSGPYPSFISRDLVLDLFASRGFKSVGTFITHMKPGKTEYFVFQRD